MIEEFDSNEELLKEMHAEVESHQQKGKQEAAHRLQEQVNLLEVSEIILLNLYRRLTFAKGFKKKIHKRLAK